MRGPQANGQKMRPRLRGVYRHDTLVNSGSTHRRLLKGRGDLCQLPAGAGQRSLAPRSSPYRTSTPCGCGATVVTTNTATVSSVNSLRVRGNGHRCRRRRHRCRQLPAGAGQRRSLSAKISVRRSTPCGCGATSLVSCSKSIQSVNSLRVWGNAFHRDIAGVDLSAPAPCPRNLRVPG